MKILYNRTMVQLGICAFRQGMIKDAHNALLDIQSSGRAKELLGQGLLMRNMQERNAEQEKIEKRRQVGDEEDEFTPALFTLIQLQSGSLESLNN